MHQSYTPPDLEGLVFFTNDFTSLSKEDLTLYYSNEYNIPVEDIHIHSKLNERKEGNHIYFDNKHKVFVIRFRHKLDSLIHQFNLTHPENKINYQNIPKN